MNRSTTVSAYVFKSITHIVEQRPEPVIELFNYSGFLSEKLIVPVGQIA